MDQSAGSGANLSNPDTLDMSTRTAPTILVRLVAPADIIFNGNRPWDIQVNNPETYYRIPSRGALGFGEAYMEGMSSQGIPLCIQLPPSLFIRRLTETHVAPCY